MAPKEKWHSTHDEEQSLMAENCDDDSVSSTTGFRSHKTSRYRQLFRPSISTMKDLILVAFAISGFVSLLQSPTNIHSHFQSEGTATPDNLHAAPAVTSCDCGNSTAEAVTLGCKYDSLAAAWLPEHCRDDELTAEFERSGPGPDGQWTYWADTAHTQEISVEEIAKMADNQEEMRFHMSGHWHVLHCIFYWRKEYRARFNGKIVEPRSDNEKHIKHCGKIFLDPGYGTVAGVALNTDMDLNYMAPQALKLPSPTCKYRPLNDETATNPSATAKGSTTRQPSRLVFVSLLATVTILGTLLLILLSLHLRLLQSTVPKQKLSCGSSVAEAQQAGCAFDALAKAWLPTACPRYGLAEFEAAAGATHNQSRWRYWRDQAGEEELSMEDLASLGRSEKWWGTEREHLTHCAWMLVRKARAFADGGRVDKLTADFDHSKHCIMLLLWRALQAEGIDEMDTSGNVVFGGC
ncbi:hypothetical protein CABS01_01157 [Colletotrichum abscissum]|uniref:Uncharacterized protein n=1 Tax=Colletotrichum abscissum TaxID=1671311 RepID=A0A9P9XBG9_9PEZI|nr:uncharacterized protein CABS01_01157 [Colletotrichum abscissum]KAI3546925.1 hypothetical protein CABS02_08774 [Colletotrichum abscissum]KAK1505689.1 hypothetical protein CABS01_01157 [Colletotrichum abscissum]